MQRKLLTVLFGQSGLGKTSILRAGLVPRLRGHGYCPIYVRIAYSPDAPEPGEQIKQTILQTARHAGQWTQAGVASAGESLWEFLHHRDDVLLDEAGKPLIPLLIFDQFEEIFTLAQTDEAGRARAARFIDDLADLVENRAPRDARGEAGSRRLHGRALRLRARRLPRADLAARGLPRAARKPEGADAEHHAEPPAPRADDGPAGPRGGDGPRQGPRVAGGRRGDRALRGRRRGDPECRGRALAAQPHLPRAQRHAHRRGAGRNLAGAAGRLAGLHPRQLLRARARGPAGGRAPDHRGRAADRIRLPRERLGGNPACALRRRRRLARDRWRRSSTGACCASRSGSTCAASS